MTICVAPVSSGKQDSPQFTEELYLLQNRMRNVMLTWARIFYAFLRLFTRSRAVLAAICWSRFVTIATAELCTKATRHRACAPVAPRAPNAIH